MTIRFRCPACDKTIKVPEEALGQQVLCPRCGELVEATESPRAAARGGGGSAPARRLAFFSEMRTWVRGAVGGLAAVGTLSVLVAVVRPEWAGGLADWAVPLAAVCFVAVVALLHGHGSGCPLCGRLWTRDKTGTEFVDREVFEEGGVSYARSHYRTSYRCSGCGGVWSVDEEEVYQAPAVGERRRARG